MGCGPDGAKCDDCQCETTNTKEYNRFDLEQAIVSFSGIVDDLQMFKDTYFTDQSHKHYKEFVESLCVVYNAKFDRLWDIFEQMITKRKIS